LQSKKRTIIFTKMQKILLFLSIVLLSACQKNRTNSVVSSDNQKVSPQATTPAYVGLYVDNFQLILADTAKENKLLRWAKKNNFNALTLYGINYYLPYSSNYVALQKFITKAKNNYAIKEVNMTGGSAVNFTNDVSLYNASCSLAVQKLNWCNLEREFWNGDQSFNFSYTIMDATKTWGVAQTPSVKIEEYIGWLKDSVTAPVNPAREASIADSIVKVVDRLLVHDYQANLNFAYVQPRLNLLGQAAIAHGKKLDVVIIFSAEQSFSRTYFSNNPFINAFTLIKNANTSATYSGKAGINLVGYQIFTYADAILARP
jgi:hypothetical protein